MKGPQKLQRPSQHLIPTRGSHILEFIYLTTSLNAVSMTQLVKMHFKAPGKLVANAHITSGIRLSRKQWRTGWRLKRTENPKGKSSRRRREDVSRAGDLTVLRPGCTLWLYGKLWMYLQTGGPESRGRGFFSCTCENSPREKLSCAANGENVCSLNTEGPKWMIKAGKSNAGNGYKCE